ncbi:MAG: hypothetical protein JWO20_2435 [Candidatus Angelobacter sp.]|nr:hypothetical protein [Candidatus Angelobacter sp.]
MNRILLIDTVLFLVLACGTASAQQEPQASRTVTQYRIASGAWNPARMIQTQRQENGRTIETQIVEAPSDGGYQAISETEQETIQVDANTVRVVQRLYTPVDGTRKPYQTTEEERHTGPGDRETVVRTISALDSDGHSQVLERDIEESDLTAPDVRETNTTVLRLVAGTLAPVQKFEQTEHSNGDSVEVQRNMLAPDGSDHFQVIQAERSVVTQTKDGQTSQSTMYGNDGRAPLTPIEQTTGSEWKSGDTQREMSQTFSVNVPGRTPDDHLHLVQQQSLQTVAAPGGGTLTETQVHEVNPGAPEDGLRLTTVETETSQLVDKSQTENHKQVRSLDINGNFPIDWEENSRTTTKPK